MTLKQELLDLSDKFYKRFTERIADLGDEEYLWEPAPDCWSLSRGEDGRLHMRWGLVFDEVPPVTTIAWRYTHVIDLLCEERCAKNIGLEPEAENIFEDGAPADARAAREMLEKAFARWKRYVAATDEDKLFDKMGAVAGRGANATRARFVLHILDEVIHHGAEIGVLRDLWRAQRSVDADISALLRGEDLSAAKLEDVKARRPDLMLFAAATARWDAIPSLLAKGFSIEGRGGRTPLHHAAADGRLELMRLLIDAGSDLHARDPVYRATPSEWADFFARREAMELLAKSTTKDAARAQLSGDWDRWVAAVESFPESRIREGGVAGDWTIHDVVAHVQGYARFHLSQARGAMSGREPDRSEWYGDRTPPPNGESSKTVDERNENMRISAQGLSWQQVVDEARWLRAETLGWFDGIAEFDEEVGWIPFSDPGIADMKLIVRRTSEVEGLQFPMPLWRFLSHGDHMDEHLSQIRAWLGAKVSA